jgi:hypothetical protein
MDEMLALTGLSVAALTYAALTLIPVALCATGKWWAAVLIALSLLPAAYAFYEYWSYSPIEGGTRSLGAIFWTASPTLIAIVYRVVLKSYPALRSAVLWQTAAVLSIMMPILFASGMFGYAFFTWRGW